MPRRKTTLVDNEFYHVFNRGNDRKNIFLFPSDYRRFIKILYYYQFSGPKPKFSQFTKSKFNFFNPITDTKLVDIICYCLMPNHFHLLLRQKEEGGISKFISQISNSYTKYFNTKYRKLGHLFQGAFKAVFIENNEQLLHVSRYIHLNPVVAKIVLNINQYSWSSYIEYKFGDIFCLTKEILSFFDTRETYLEFLDNQVEYGQTLEFIKHHTFDDD